MSPTSPALVGRLFTTSATWEAQLMIASFLASLPLGFLEVSTVSAGLAPSPFAEELRLVPCLALDPGWSIPLSSLMTVTGLGHGHVIHAEPIESFPELQQARMWKRKYKM